MRRTVARPSFATSSMRPRTMAGLALSASIRMASVPLASLLLLLLAMGPEGSTLPRWRSRRVAGTRRDLGQRAFQFGRAGGLGEVEVEAAREGLVAILL